MFENMVRMFLPSYRKWFDYEGEYSYVLGMVYLPFGETERVGRMLLSTRSFHISDL